MKNTDIWQEPNQKIRMQNSVLKPWQMEVQCSLILINLLNSLCQMTSTGESWWVSDLIWRTSRCYQWNMMEHTASLLYTRWETQNSEGISLCPEALCFPTHYQKMKEKSTLSKNVREFSSLSSNIVDDTRSTVAKDLTWVLVIIPALSLAYLCNLGLNKALWNTICTNRHLKSYFHPYG